MAPNVFECLKEFNCKMVLVKAEVVKTNHLLLNLMKSNDRITLLILEGLTCK